jgi:hypothetical protein
MKTALRISLLLNAVLIGAILLLPSASRNGPSAATPAAFASSSSSPQSVSAGALSKGQTPNPFRWSQIESTKDYLKYAANLRAIGCPERTIRAIVAAEIDARHSSARQRLSAQSRGTRSFSRRSEAQHVAGPPREPTAPPETNGTPQHAENAARFESGPIEEAAQSSARNLQNEKPLQAATTPPAQNVFAAQYPLVLEPAVMNDPTLNPAQKAAVAQLQQQFIDQVAGGKSPSSANATSQASGASPQTSADSNSQSPNGSNSQNPGDPTAPNPSDPGYLPKWQQAQNDANDQLRGVLGDQAYMQYLLGQYYQSFSNYMAAGASGPFSFAP